MGTLANCKSVTIKEIFESLHDKNNKRFYNQLVILTQNDENYTCALTDELVRYGTDDFSLFEAAVKKIFLLMKSIKS